MTNHSRKSNSGGKGTPVPGLRWKAGPHSWNLESRALVMAILNVTPDSFSDGGEHFRPESAIATAHRFAIEGADLIDVGGESTRPGADQISPQEECERVIPVIENLSGDLPVPVSVDTRKVEVARRALQAGATIVNDVSGFEDSAMIALAASSHCGLVAMHMQGDPQTMQRAPKYRDVVDEVEAFFEERLRTLTKAGIDPERIAFDPGIGFGKTLAHNLALLHGIGRFQKLGRPVLIGLSRKSFLATLLGSKEMEAREAPTQALTCLARRFGASIHRVHQVRHCREALRMTESLVSPGMAKGDNACPAARN